MLSASLNKTFPSIYGYIASNIIMVKDHLDDSETGNLLPLLSAWVFYMHHPTDRRARTTAFVTPVVEHWLQREIAQWVHREGPILRHSSHQEWTLYHGATTHSYWTSLQVITGMCAHDRRMLYQIALNVHIKLNCSVMSEDCRPTHLTKI